MAGNNGDRASSKVELIVKLSQDRFHESMAHLAVVQCDKDQSFAGRIFQGQRLNHQRLVDPVSGLGAARIPGEADRQLRGDIPHGDSGFKDRQVSWSCCSAKLECQANRASDHQTTGESASQIHLQLCSKARLGVSC